MYERRIVAKYSCIYILRQSFFFLKMQEEGEEDHVEKVYE